MLTLGAGWLYLLTGNTHSFVGGAFILMRKMPLFLLNASYSVSFSDFRYASTKSRVSFHFASFFFETIFT